MLTVPITPIHGGYPVVPSRDDRPVSGFLVDLELLPMRPHDPPAPRRFRLDTGAACSGISLAAATTLGLLRDTDRFFDLRVREAGGAPKVKKLRFGRLVAKLPALRDEPFDWPVAFHDHWPEAHPFLLGLAGVLDDLTLHVDGTPGPVSEYGSVTVALRDRPPPAS